MTQLLLEETNKGSIGSQFIRLFRLSIRNRGCRLSLMADEPLQEPEVAVLPLAEQEALEQPTGITLRAEEFQAIQEQLNALKTQVYDLQGKEKKLSTALSESQAKEKKLQSLGLQWKQKCKNIDEEYQKAKALIIASKSAKDVARCVFEWIVCSKVCI